MSHRISYGVTILFLRGGDRRLHCKQTVYNCVNKYFLYVSISTVTIEAKVRMKCFFGGRGVPFAHIEMKWLLPYNCKVQRIFYFY